jgi:hypothetical protein
MVRAIELLRKTADECECQANLAVDRATEVELFEMAAHWHRLAGEIANLHDRSKQVEATRGAPWRPLDMLPQSFDVCFSTED